jgi:uncharacterized protein YgbK (DUF1537 family)
MSIPHQQALPASVLAEHVRETTNTADQQMAYLAAGAWDNRLILVLDDDPTGVQTVHGVYVYMQWSEEILLHIFTHERLAFIQTNTRSMPEQEAVALTRQIMQLAISASKQTGREFTVISRSDSSLRGHYPAETDAVRKAMEEAGKRVDGEIICFFLAEAGRYTIDNVHYIREKDTLVPVAETEFARDAVFGYRYSDLTLYVEEKTRGAVHAEQVWSVPLTLLRQPGQEVAELLCTVSKAQKVIVNCTSYGELKQFVRGLKGAEQKGKRFLFRTAASFVKIYGYIPDKPVLPSKELFSSETPATASVLTIIGSHTAKTNRQLDALLRGEKVEPIELSVEELLKEEAKQSYISKAVSACEQAMLDGKHPVVFSSRKVVVGKGASAEENLQISQQVSHALAAVVKQLSLVPRAIIAKGGITSSDVAVRGLGVEKALILGQIRPSIPVIRTGSESKFPGLPLVIFPGNTGEEQDLLEIFRTLTAGK